MVGVLPAQGWWGSYQLRGRGSVDCSTPGSSVLHYLPLTFMSIESVMPSNHLILCRLLLLWLQSFPTSASSPLSDFHGFSLELNQSFFISTFLPIALPLRQSHGFPAEPSLKGRQAGDRLARRRPRDVAGHVSWGQLGGGSADHLAELRPIPCTRAGPWADTRVVPRAVLIGIRGRREAPASAF